MSGFQRYLFRNVLKTLLAIVGGLALIALLDKGLEQIELIDNRQSLLVYLWVSVLTAPQIVSLLMPIALFVATTGALNIAHRENEIVVAQASGMSNWGVASPVMRLAVLAAIVHLGLNLWVQPAAYREFRETVSAASSDLATQLVKQGAFMRHANGLTTFAREVNGAQMRDVLINDASNPQDVQTWISKSAYFAEAEGAPIIVMKDAQMLQLNPNGEEEPLHFDQATFELGPFVADQKAVVLKESDRYLPELFYPDMSNYYDNANVKRLLAEGHARIAAPLLDIAMALIAIYAVLGGDFSRRGYATRIALASASAVALRLAAFGADSAGIGDPKLNVLQYLLPIAVIAVISMLHFMKPKHGKRMKGAGPKQRPMRASVAAAAAGAA